MTIFIDKKQQFGKIKRMIRLFKKWWVLKGLRDESLQHGLDDLSLIDIQFGIKHRIVQWAIVKQLVAQSRIRFSWFLFWRKNINDKKEKKRSWEYSSILNEAKREELVYVVGATDGRRIESNLNRPGDDWLITTDLGDKYIAEFWYKVLKATFFNAYATGIIVAIVIAISSYYIKQIFQDVNTPPIVNVYPDITLPEMKPTINPIINVYPNK